MFTENNYKIPHLSFSGLRQQVFHYKYESQVYSCPRYLPKGKKAKLLICRFLTAPSSVYIYFPFRQTLMNALTAMVFANKLGLHVKTSRAVTVAFANRVFSWTVTEEHVQVKD